MTIRTCVVASLVLVGLTVVATAEAQTPAAQFDQRCATCHGSPSNERAPSSSALRLMTPERIYTALTTGVMQSQADGITDPQKRALAEYLSERKIVASDAASAATMSNRCQTRAPMTGSGPSWNGWGVDLTNSRFQPAEPAALSVEQASRLKLKWAFGFPGATSVYAQPTVIGDRLFVEIGRAHV